MNSYSVPTIKMPDTSSFFFFLKLFSFFLFGQLFWSFKQIFFLNRSSKLEQLTVRAYACGHAAAAAAAEAAAEKAPDLSATLAPLGDLGFVSRNSASSSSRSRVCCLKINKLKRPVLSGPRVKASSWRSWRAFLVVVRSTETERKMGKRRGKGEGRGGVGWGGGGWRS